MISVTKLDGTSMMINELNIQWIEALPDTAVTFIGGARLLIREKPEEVASLIGAIISNAKANDRQEFGSAKALP